MIELFNVLEIDCILNGMTIKKRMNENIIKTQRNGKNYFLKIDGNAKHVFCDVIRNKPTIIVCCDTTVLYVFDENWKEHDTMMEYIYHNSNNIYFSHPFISLDLSLIDLDGVTIDELTIDKNIHINESNDIICHNKCIYNIDDYSLLESIVTTKKYVHIGFETISGPKSSVFTWIIINRQTYEVAPEYSAPHLLTTRPARLFCQGHSYNIGNICDANDIIVKRGPFYFLTKKGVTRAFGLYNKQNLQYLSNKKRKRLPFYLWLLKTPSRSNIVLNTYIPKPLFIQYIIPELLNVIKADN